MHLSLGRIGWKADWPLDWIDDKVAKHSLVHTTPIHRQFSVGEGCPTTPREGPGRETRAALRGSSSIQRQVNPCTQGIGLSAQCKSLVKAVFCN
eukprot:8760711-Pyramimonas_sp.AAC.1